MLLAFTRPAAVARAADDSNIPGVPLPSHVVEGLLGGPIYDHVYSLDVPASSVILLSLSGSSGSDFGLYLFDSSATTVYSTQGQVAVSAQPGPNQSLSYPTFAGGLFYIDLNGASNVEGRFRLVVSVEPDRVPPVATVKLDGGAAATSDPTVRVTLIAGDDLSVVDSMALSLDGSSWGEWVAYTPTFLWTLEPGDGPKELWARVRDAAGNISKPTAATILLETLDPTVVSRSPGPNEQVAGLRPTFSVRFSEPMDPATWLHQGLVVQRLNGTTIVGRYAWSAATLTGTFVPDAPLVAGASLSCSLAGLTSLAGTPLAPIGTWLVTPLRLHTIGLNARPAVVTSGQDTELVGHVDGPVFGAMTLQRSSGDGWTAVASIRPDVRGAFAIRVGVITNTWYRVSIGGSQTDAATTSAPIRVLARRVVEFEGAGSSGGSAHLGGPIVLRVALWPIRPDVTVRLFVAKLGTLAVQAQVTPQLVTMSSGGAGSFTWHPTARGSYALWLTTVGGHVFATGRSQREIWTIT
jgi:hypothetical protein